ncbi:hypothetical protein KP509_06G007600 [Ceratopteris richardii]|nr:hypothetical protein KP509_06G007600 [Ceratopteris richardii]
MYEGRSEMLISSNASTSILEHVPPQHRNQILFENIASGTGSLFSDACYMENFAAMNGTAVPEEEYLFQGMPFGTHPKVHSRSSFPREGPSSAEVLLDIISVAQQRLQQLEAVLRMIILGTGDRSIAAQQYHFCSLRVGSILSQIMAAMASFSSPQRRQTSSHASVQLNDAFDFSFDGLNADDLNISDGGWIFGPPSSASDMDITELKNPEMHAVGNGHFTAPEAGADRDSKERARIFSAVNADNAQISVKGDLTKGIVNHVQALGSAWKSCEGNEEDNRLSEHQREDEEDDGVGEEESLPPGSYELVELAATEILAEHTHFCEICGKGFKRDANLRMHMRGHGDEYKTAAALARPDKIYHDASLKPRRYSCPYDGCKRNKKHHKFQPLKTMLCVKNHYRRSHCPKVLVCSRCKIKKFSVVADLKTHEKHCGQEKWQCSCGTTFSRKDKLFGHVELFKGHSPALPVVQETEALTGVNDTSKNLTSTGRAAASGLYAAIPNQASTTESKTNQLQGSQTVDAGDINAAAPVVSVNTTMKVDVNGQNLEVGTFGSLGSTMSSGIGSQEFQCLLSDGMIHHAQRMN